MEVEIQNKIKIKIDSKVYEFEYIQDLVPNCKNGVLDIYNHIDSKYNDLKKNKYGEKDFCKFKIKYPKKISGVYLWVVESEIIYIGETEDLLSRFNTNYGHITPYNCIIKGQTTNCKMNNTVLELFRKHNKIVHLYFLPTPNNKEVEAILLANINTKYNSKNNKNT